MPEAKNPEILDALPAGYAEAGRFPDAVQTAQPALRFAQAAGLAEQARQIEERLRSYRTVRPYHDGSVPGR